MVDITTKMVDIMNLSLDSDSRGSLREGRQLGKGGLKAGASMVGPRGLREQPQ